MEIPQKKLDLIDIEDALKWPNYLIATKGFSQLVERILRKKYKEPKETEANTLRLFFDCFHAFGDTPLDLLLNSFPILLENEALTTKQIIDEFSLRLDKISKVYPAFFSVVDNCELTYSQFLTLASRMKNTDLFEMCLDITFQKKHLKYIKPLVFSGLMSEEQMMYFGNSPNLQKVFLTHFPHLYPRGRKVIFDAESYLKDCAEEELKLHPLEMLDHFQVLRLLLARPGLCHNPKLTGHILYLPFLCYLPSVVTSQGAYMDMSTSLNDKKRCNELCVACRSNVSFKPLNFLNDSLTVEKMISDLVEHDNIVSFVRFVENYKDWLPMFKKPEMLCFLMALVALKPQPLVQERICALIAHYIEQVPQHADTFYLWSLGLFGSSIVDINKKLALDTMVNMCVSRFMTEPIIRTLVFASHQSQHLRAGFEAMVKLVRKCPSVADKFSTYINLEVQDDDEDLFRAKVELAKACCIETENNHDVLQLISGLFKRTGFHLLAGIDVLRDLLDAEVIGLKNLRQLVEKNNLLEAGKEKSLASYCRVLGFGSVPDEEETDEANESMRKDCIKELHKLTKHSKSFVVSAAWKAFGEFEAADIGAVIGIPGSSFGAEFKKVAESQQEAFVEFLRQQVHKEVETYSRLLYNVGAETVELPPLLSKVDSYKDQMLLKKKDEPWFWSATLPLTGSILQLAAPSNKVLTATRLLKSCLMSVPLSTSHDDLLRLMAGWRICVRETLNVLSESKSNDILWARDQICQEGKVALTQKAESVDNIMMMLTVLADVIDDKLKVVEDQKHVADVANAQKPWIISVLEFVATRLPKEVKQKREPKANPIYQVLTNSNKSSLHIAIFCTRLLFCNPNILEFYGDGSELQLSEDRMLISLLKDPSQQLENDEVPNRKALFLTAEAYGADEMTTNAFYSNYQPIIDAKSPIGEEPSLEVSEDVEQFFASLVLSPKRSMLEIQRKNRKHLEKIWNNGNEEIKRSIYEGLADLALSSGSSRKRKMLPIEKLPEASVLRGILQMFDEKHNLEAEELQKLTCTFVNHKRSDGRFLPPIDWMTLLEKCEWSGSTLQSRLAIVTLACEQHLSEVLFVVSEHLTPKETVLFAEHLPVVAKLLPRNQFMGVLAQMAEIARAEKDMKAAETIVKAIAAQEKNPTVRMFLTQDLPTLYNPIGVTDCVLNALNEPEALKGTISSNFDLWLEARRADKMNMQRICDLMSAETLEDRIESMIAILSLETRKLSLAKRLEKVLDVITASRIARSQEKDMSSFLPIVLALIVAISDKVDVPICFFGSEKRVVPLLIAARLEFWKPFLGLKELEKHVEHLGSFFRPYIEGSEIYDSWQRLVAKDLLLSLICNFSTKALPSLYSEPDVFWDVLVPSIV